MKYLTALDSLTPKKIVEELDTYIIGQKEAKKAVAIALRNRARRKLIPEEMKDEVAPKNIIMIGPTGVGKTEIARRLAKLCNAPFVKVEATKYTEVGYVGKDVESMVRDLMNVSIDLVKKELRNSVMDEAVTHTEELILDALLPNSRSRTPHGVFTEQKEITPDTDKSNTREKFREMLRTGQLDDKTIEIKVTSSSSPMMEMFSGAGFEAMGINLSDLGSAFGGKSKEKRKKVTVQQARKILLDQEIDRLIDMDKVTDIAIERVENDGIIFIDELDKVAVKSRSSGNSEVSREGVQRDLLPIIEGSQVHTKYGQIKTDHILFIAAGAFHMSKPSDLLPELQGRFPIRVELNKLNREDFIKILTVPKNALTLQYEELLKTEGLRISFTKDALDSIAEFAFTVNNETENIGARRLHTIMERLLEEISFEAPEMDNKEIKIDKEYVHDHLKDIVQDQDLSHYIL